MVRAFKLYTGPDNASHVLEGTIDEKDRTDVVAHFKETPAHSSFDWHNDPDPQYVITLSGQVEIETGDGTVKRFGPGDVMLADDTTGHGHITRVVGNQPRVYVMIPLK